MLGNSRTIMERIIFRDCLAYRHRRLRAVRFSDRRVRDGDAGRALTMRIRDRTPTRVVDSCPDRL